MPVDEVSAMDADLEQQVRAFAAVRIAIGAAALVAPGLGVRKWLGPDSDGPGARLLMRMAGGRDVALGIGTLFAVRHGSPVRGWLEAGMLADTTDLVGSLFAVRHLRRVPVTAGALSSLGAAAYGRRLISRLPAAPA